MNKMKAELWSPPAGGRAGVSSPGPPCGRDRFALQGSPGWVSCSLSVAGHFPAGTLGSCLTELMGKSVRLATEDQTETEKHVEKQPGLRSLQDTLLLAQGPRGESTQRLYPSAELSRAPCLLRVGSSAWLESQ